MLVSSPRRDFKRHKPSVKDDAIIIRVDLARGAESDQVNLRALTQTIREVKRDGKNVVSSGR